MINVFGNCLCFVIWMFLLGFLNILLSLVFMIDGILKVGGFDISVMSLICNIVYM